MSEGFQTIGTCMAFSAALPATYNDTGYSALTWTDTIETTQFGDVGPESEVITFITVCDGKVNKRPGSTNYGQQSLEFAYVPDDDAQILLKAAAKTRDPVAVRETLWNGDIIYYVGYVTRAKTMVGGPTDFVRLGVNFEVDSETLEVLAA